jgi:hypothetical protein
MLDLTLRHAKTLKVHCRLNGTEEGTYSTMGCRGLEGPIKGALLPGAVPVDSFI